MILLVGRGEREESKIATTKDPMTHIEASILVFTLSDSC